MRHDSVSRFLGLAMLLLACSCAEGQSPTESEYSFSLKEARRRGTLITKVRMSPSGIKWRKWEITIGDAWLEKSESGGCYLCFHIAKGKEALYPLVGGFFVLGDLNEGGHTHFGLRGKWIQAVQHLDSPDLSKVRLSFVGSLKDKRLKNITFIPTK